VVGPAVAEADGSEADRARAGWNAHLAAAALLRSDSMYDREVLEGGMVAAEAR